MDERRASAASRALREIEALPVETTTSLLRRDGERNVDAETVKVAENAGGREMSVFYTETARRFR